MTATPSGSRVGWLGTGRMGSAMAGRLVDAGFDVTVWNRTRSKTEPLEARGAHVADAMADLGALDVVFIMVSTPADLAEVLTGGGGLLTGTTLPGLIVDSSTVSPDASAAMRAAATDAGVAFLAAPISGNPRVVAAGGASMIASGPRDAFEQARPYLESIARVAVYAGPAEQSRIVKLASNLYLGMLVEALVEVTTLAEKTGTDRAAFLEFLNGTVLGCEWVRERTADLLGRSWTSPTFTTELLRKDFDLGLAAARAHEVPMPVASATYQLIQSGIGTGLRDLDFLSLYEQQARAAGLTDDRPA